MWVIDGQIFQFEIMGKHYTSMVFEDYYNSVLVFSTHPWLGATFYTTTGPGA